MILFYHTCMANVGELASPELRKVLTGPEIIVEANTYRTKNITLLTIDGITDEWHLLKGGIADGKPEEAINEILYSPTTNTWLKLIPFGARNRQDLENRLKPSPEIQKTALIEAGLPEYAQHVREHIVVNKAGQTEYGFTMPHIGPSVELILKKLLYASPEVKTLAKGVLSGIYSTAFLQATRLYLMHGMWTDDVNPGNVLIHMNEQGDLTPVLIDFTNKANRKYNGNGSNSAEDAKVIAKSVMQLFAKFSEQCERHGIPFPDQQPEILDILRKYQ
jgi:hypothetical protein